VSWAATAAAPTHLPSVFADVALYARSYATPAWAPLESGGTVPIAGTARAGRTLTCRLRDFELEQGTRLGRPDQHAVGPAQAG
jgi:hypothetical protein